MKYALSVMAYTVTALLSANEPAAAAPMVMPQELTDYAQSQGCLPIDDFYERPGMLNPPYVYGFAAGEAEDSAAVWCQRPEPGKKAYAYVLLLKVRDPKTLQGCPSRIEWWNPPKGLSIELQPSLKLSEFHFVLDPKRSGPPATLSNMRVIVSEYDGVEDRFVCHQGAWLFMQRD